MIKYEEVEEISDLSKIDIRKMPVKECDDLAKEEKETHILFDKKNNLAKIETWDRSWILYLRKKKSFKPTKAFVSKDGQYLVGLWGLIPKTAIKISDKSSQRLN